MSARQGVCRLPVSKEDNVADPDGDRWRRKFGRIRRRHVLLMSLLFLLLAPVALLFACVPEDRRFVKVEPAISWVVLGWVIGWLMFRNWRCPRCGDSLVWLVGGWERFCPRCGHERSGAHWSCATCGMFGGVVANVRFCPKCGVRLSGKPREGDRDAPA
jgi:hypothetical protein